jgi:hypothetical protein
MLMRLNFKIKNKGGWEFKASNLGTKTGMLQKVSSCTDMLGEVLLQRRSASLDQ